ncbi:hypothetical protein [Candidatus Ichthyocystis hellenicum]|uniref:hypothetical protein n=1 Tax=Candidatus Ichthyocystis hellenicum TaxID=1561003 RepID=UPI000B896902|nr:hypothetical protein [Candidatus Ichthyocystis hellenicum]
MYDMYIDGLQHYAAQAVVNVFSDRNCEVTSCRYGCSEVEVESPFTQMTSDTGCSVAFGSSGFSLSGQLLRGIVNDLDKLQCLGFGDCEEWVKGLEGIEEIEEMEGVEIIENMRNVHIFSDIFETLEKYGEHDVASCIDTTSASAFSLEDICLPFVVPTCSLKEGESFESLEFIYARLGITEDQITHRFGLNIHPCDYSDILPIRESFLVEVRSSVSNLFTGMLREKSVLPSGKVLGNYQWCDSSSELFPIAMELIESIVDKYIKSGELYKILSRLRVLDSGGSASFCPARKVRDDERYRLMGFVKAFMCEDMVSHVGSVWMSVVNAEYSEATVPGAEGCVGSDLSPVYKINVEEVDETSIGCGASKINIYHEDNRTISKVKRKFSSMIVKCIRDKYCKMINEGHEFKDRTIVSGRCAWIDISKNMLPIVREKVEPILEEERAEISDVLSRSRVEVLAPNGFSIVRDISSKERFFFLEKFMKSVRRQTVDKYSKLWARIVKFQRTKVTCGDYEYDRKVGNSVSGSSYDKSYHNYHNKDDMYDIL